VEVRRLVSPVTGLSSISFSPTEVVITNSHSSSPLVGKRQAYGTVWTNTWISNLIEKRKTYAFSWRVCPRRFNSVWSPSLYSLHRRTFFLKKVFSLLLFLLTWHYAPFHEEWGLSLDKLNGWWVPERKFGKLQTDFRCLRACKYETNY
jgi:hypothetical protein